MNEYAEKIEFHDFSIKIDQNRFIERLNTRIVEIIGRPWDFWYGLTLKYKDEFGNPNAPQGYKTNEGYQLGTWHNNQRGNFRKGKLSPEQIKRLNDIGFIWERLEKRFEKGFHETLLYKESISNPYATPLSTFQIANPNVPADHKAVEDYRQWTFQIANPNVPANYKTAEGYRLGAWQNTQRVRYKIGKLSPERIKRLEETGFLWKRLEEQFEKGFQETLLYKEKTGTPNAPKRYMTSEGYRLGNWQILQRVNYNKGILSPDRIKRLEDIGFKWGKEK
jgi:hypothetical protein